MLQDAAARSNVIQQLDAFLKAQKDAVDALLIDFEGVAVEARDGLSAFVQEAVAALDVDVRATVYAIHLYNASAPSAYTRPASKVSSSRRDDARSR